MVEGRGGRVVELLTQDLLAEILLQNHVTSLKKTTAKYQL